MVDLRNCKRGDLLISCHGMPLFYIGPTEPNQYLDHVVLYFVNSDGEPCTPSPGTRSHSGETYLKNKMETDHDIVQVVPKDEIRDWAEGVLLVEEGFRERARALNTLNALEKVDVENYEVYQEIVWKV